MGYLNITTTKRKLSLHIPSSWYDVTFEQWLQLQAWDKKDLIKLIAILSGESLDTILTLPSSKADMKTLKSLSFLYDPAFELDQIKMPKVLRLDDMVIEIPQDIMKETLGQKIMLMQFINDPDYSVQIEAEVKETDKVKGTPEVRDHAKVLHICAAIYLQPALDQSNFDAEKAEGYFDKFLKLPVTDVYPIGSFFLDRSKIAMKPGMKGLLPQIAQSIKKGLRWLMQPMSKGLKALKIS